MTRNRRDENCAMAEFRRQREADTAGQVTSNVDPVAQFPVADVTTSETATPPVTPPVAGGASAPSTPRPLRPLTPPPAPAATRGEDEELDEVDADDSVQRVVRPLRAERPSRLEELVNKMAETQIRGWVFFIAVAVWLVGGILTVESGAAVLGHSWRLGILVPGGLVTMIGAWVLLHLGANQGRKRRRIAIVLASVVLSVAALGIASSVVVNGRVVAATSTTAAVYRTAQEYADDFRLLQQAEHVTNYSAADLQANVNQIQPLINRLAAMNASVGVATPPVRTLWVVAQDLKTASFYAGEALTGELQLANTTDSALAAQLANQVATASQSMQTSRDRAFFELDNATQPYGFSIPRSVK